MRRTPLYNEHKKLGAKFTEFGGWEMPVYYTSIIDEHNAVRRSVGMFDTSHMGTFIISGKDIEKFLNYVTLGNMSGLPDKKARYSMFLNEDGGIKDDIIVYKLGSKYMIVVNAGNLNKDFQWLNKHKPTDIQIENISDDISLLAVQGPKAVSILQSIADTDITSMKYFTVSELKLKDITADFCKIARTGYTGEDGFEIFIPKEKAPRLWERLISLSVKSCGLGCRDSLRLEACMPLHGHEIDESINPIESGFQKTINWDNNFIGRNKLISIKDKPLKKSVAFECLSGIARTSNKVFLNNKNIGYVTSGLFSPTFKKAIGMALIDLNVQSDNLEVAIHNNRRKLRIVPKPFYKRPRQTHERKR
ncbi:MAG: glycine cleavage system aminomethyltransferase GcvT [Endomicrobium sp.]|jgi:glycine cleavage system T protein|nr:glycine cleavage system aminomethyltransferase GcvT [Endomicrobium sp.]